MDNKKLIEKAEEECYDDLLKITNVRDFNKDVGEKELKAIHDNKASFKFMFAYVLNTIINSECPNSSYITFGHHFSLSYLMNFLKMSPYNSNDLSEHYFNAGLLDGDKFPYFFNNNEPTIKRVDPEVMYSFNIMLKIDFKYFYDNIDFVLEQIKKHADVYNLVSDKDTIINNEFIVVPEGYKVDDPSKFTRDYVDNDIKDGEIYFRIYPYNFNYSFYHLLKEKYGELDLNECLNHYKYSHKYGHLPKVMLYPSTRFDLKDSYHSLKNLFNECLIDYSLRNCQAYDSIKRFPTRYFIFLDDIYHKFIDMGYSFDDSYTNCKLIHSYLWSKNEEENELLKQLHKEIGDIKYKDITNKHKYRFYDDIAVEFYYIVLIALYEYKYKDEYVKLYKEHHETYAKCLRVIGA